jgi:hypothetical protein
MLRNNLEPATKPLMGSFELHRNGHYGELSECVSVKSN